MQPKWELRELTLMIHGVRLEEALGDFLPECEETLTCLHIMAALYISINSVALDHPQTTQPVPSLRHCQSLETLNLYFLFPPRPPDSDRDGLESAIRLCDRALAVNAEILLASPPTLRTVKIMFMYYEKPDYAIDRLFAGMEHWGRLDDAICRLEHAELVCTLAGDFKVVNDGPARHMFEVGY
ncbi:hypothetical protein C8T65DRAFT_829120 [Cerioporus squamosus]|nr:hypothetical protein C8T65DRAFT_829120 [Cerioporus squamosus]